MLRTITFFISLTMLVASLFSVLEYWRYDEVMRDVVQLMHGNVDVQQLEAQVEQALEEGNPEEARMYLAIARTFGYSLDEQQFAAQIAELETPWQTTRRQTGRFVNGFIEGEGESAAGVAGAITADFTVVGDVRDLNEQYGHYSRGEDVNEFIVTLAGIGVGLTAATVISAGTAAPAKSAISALKLAGRSGKLTPKMQRVLLRQGRQVFDYQGFLRAARSEPGLAGLRGAAINAYDHRAMQALGDTTQRVDAIRRSTSLTDSVSLLRYVESTDDLRRLEKVSLKYGDQTKGIMKFLGKGAIGTTRILRRSTELILSMGAALFSLLATFFSLRSLVRRR